VDWPGERVANSIVDPTKTGGDLLPEAIMSVNIEPVVGLDNVVEARPVSSGGDEPLTERVYWKLGVKLTIIFASASVDELVIENTDDKDTVAVDISKGVVAESMDARTALKLIVIASFGEIVVVNTPGMVGPAPEVAVKVYGVEKPVTVSVNDPEAEPDVSMEYSALFEAPAFAAFVGDVLVKVICPSAVLIALAVMVAAWAAAMDRPDHTSRPWMKV
jgi:hypothetical protein